MNYYLEVLRRYSDFDGRTSRKEYWMFVWTNLIFLSIALILDNVFGIADDELGFGPLYVLYAFGTFIPALAAAVRRLHDIGKSGRMLFVALIPVVGTIWLLVLLLKNSEQGENQYGPKPEGIQTGPSLLEQLILIYITWRFVRGVFWIVVPELVDNFFNSVIYEISQRYLSVIWAIIPISFAFGIKNRTIKIIVFILAILSALISLYLSFVRYS